MRVLPSSTEKTVLASGRRRPSLGEARRTAGASIPRPWAASRFRRRDLTSADITASMREHFLDGDAFRPANQLCRPRVRPQPQGRLRAFAAIAASRPGRPAQAARRTPTRRAAVASADGRAAGPGPLNRPHRRPAASRGGGCNVLAATADVAPKSPTSREPPRRGGRGGRPRERDCRVAAPPAHRPASPLPPRTPIRRCARDGSISALLPWDKSSTRSSVEPGEAPR